MQRGITPVIVDNTNLRMKEARPYIEMANKYQYKVEIEESDSPWWLEIQKLLTDKGKNAGQLKQWAGQLAQRNIHGVPEETLHRMLKAYAPYTVDDVQKRIKLGPE